MGKENVFSLLEEEKKFIQLLKKGSSNITEVSEKFDIPKTDIIRGGASHETVFLKMGYD